MRCSCDDFADDPCPVHARENRLQNEMLKHKANEAKLRECMEEIALTGNLSITDVQDMARRTLTEIDREETKPC